MRPVVALLGLIIISPLTAEEHQVEIESDIEAKYFVISRGGGPEQQILLLKRVRPGNTVYSKRMFDCEAETYQKLGSWENLESISATCPETEMHPIQEGTIAYQLWQYACGEEQTQAVTNDTKLDNPK